MADVFPGPDDTGRHMPSFGKGLIGRGAAALRTLLTSQHDDQKTQRAAGFAFGIRVASAGLIYLSQILIARWLGTFEYGIFVFVWALVLVVGGIASLGFTLSIQRFVPEYRERGENNLLRGILFAGRFIPLASSTALAAIGAGLVWLLGDVIPVYYLVPLILACTCLPLYTVMEVHDGICRAHNWMGLALIPAYIVRPALLLVIMVAASQSGFEATAVNALYISIVTLWAAAVVQVVLTARRLRKVVDRGPKEVRSVYWTKQSLPITLVDAFALFMFNADVLLISILGTPEQTGVYFAAAKTLALVSFVTFAVAAASAARYSEYHARGDHVRLQQFVRRSIAWTFWPSLFGTIVILLAGQFLLSFFGEEFVYGYPIMFILAVGHLARASVGPMERLLNVTGHQNACARIYMFAFCTNITLNLLLIPTYGVYGAAIATTLAYVLESILLALAAKRDLGLNVMVWHRQSAEEQ
ncbi:MAG: lipopolysaccharide biosynthesis protein [Pseudomonadota bacterium]